MPRGLSNKHTVLVTVTFDKPCTKKVALRELRDTIHSKNYCTQYKDDEPGEYTIRSVKGQ